MSKSPFRPGVIYFDTNPLFGAGWPSPSAQLLQITEQSERLRITLCVPDPVNSELEGHWLRERRREWIDINDRIERLNKRANLLLSFSTLPSFPSDRALREKLRSITKEFMQRVRVAPLTKRPLSDFLELAIERGATFEESGRGFQDAVVLCSILDDMKANGIQAAVLVSEDKAFRNSGVIALEKAAGVKLRVVATLDEVEQLVRENLTEAIRTYLDRQTQQLMNALEASRSDLERYVVENLTFTADEIGVFGTIRRIGSIRILTIENAHASKLGDTGKAKISVDVKVAVELDVVRFPRQEPQRLKAGATVDSPWEPQLFSKPIIQSETRELSAVVEGVATKSGARYSEIKFTGTHLKRTNPALMDLARQLLRKKK